MSEVETVKDDYGRKPDDVARRWLREIDLGLTRYKKWHEKGGEVVEKYRDESERRRQGHKFNILWANTETMKPALFGKVPKASCRRRVMDPKSRDVVARTASIALERALNYSIDAYDFKGRMGRTVEDFLLPGRGNMCVKYSHTEAETEAKNVPIDRIDEERDDDGVAVGRRYFVDGEEIAADQVVGGEEYSSRYGTPLDDLPEDQRPYTMGEPGKRVIHEEVTSHYKHWKDVLYAPAPTWEQCRWVAFKHLLTREELDRDYGKEISKKVELDWYPKDANDDAEKAEFFKRATVWEIWDKDKREIVHIAKTCESTPLKTEEDTYKLEGFYPLPEPLDFVITNETMTPIPMYNFYQDQAEELDLITKRIDRLIDQLRVRGIYDAAQDSLKEVLNEQDGVLVPVDNFAEIADRGGVNSFVHVLEIKGIAETLVVLYSHRNQVKEIIWEIIGLSDIMRGATDPKETAKAQSLKAKFGSVRFQYPQGKVERYIRDIYRIKAELMAEHFSVEMFQQMTGMELPTEEQRAQARQALQQQDQAAQQRQQPGQPPAPTPPPVPAEVKKMAESATWDEVMALLRDDGVRGYKIDVETDSTIMLDAQVEQKARSEFMAAITSLLKEWLPGVQSGVIPPETFKAVLRFSVGAFRVGRDIEDAIEAIGDFEPGQGGGGEQEDPSKMAEVERKAAADQANIKIKGEKVQGEQQVKEAKAQAEIQALEAEAEARSRELALDERVAEQELALKRQELAMKEMIAKMDHLVDLEAARQKKQQSEASNAA